MNVVERLETNPKNAADTDVDADADSGEEGSALRLPGGAPADEDEGDGADGDGGQARVTEGTVFDAARALDRHGGQAGAVCESVVADAGHRGANDQGC